MVAHPFGDTVQSVLDGTRVVCLVLGAVVAVMLGRIAVNPARRSFPRPAKVGCPCVAIFTLLGVGTEVDRMGFDAGYWRLPMTVIGLVLAVWYIGVVARSPRCLWNPDHCNPFKEGD